MNEKNSNNILSNSTKTPKIKNFSFFNVENATNTFQRIITRYRKKRQYYQKQPKNILAFIEKAKFKAEKFETENEYMMKELRNNIKLEKEMVALFGPRAKKHYKEMNNKKIKAKIHKYDFFTPQEIKKIKEVNLNNNISTNKTKSKPELSQIIFKGRRNKFSPTIMSKKNSNLFNTYNNKFKILNKSSNSTKYQRFYRSSTNNRKYKNNKIYKPFKTFDGNDNYKKELENNKNKEYPDKLINNKIYLKTDITNFREGRKNDSEKCLNLTLNKNVNNTNNNFHFNKNVYLDNLIQINKQFLRKEQKLQNHFRNNDYGCRISKMEYRYLTKKYFN